jgi:hypothetical protein
MLEIVGAVRLTRRDIITYDQEMFRDIPPLVVGGAAIAQSGISIAAQIAGGVNPTAVEDTGNFIVEGASSVLQSDDYLHIPKRYIPKLDTIYEFWDSEDVGLAMTMSITTTLNSAVITIPDGNMLVPGQEIVATGVPANTILLAVFSQTNGIITRTTAVMSQQATGAATVAGTLSGGANLLGEFRRSEFIGWGTNVTIPS